MSRHIIQLRGEYSLFSLIYEFFENGRYLTWRFMGQALREFHTGCLDDIISNPDFLKLFFKNDPKLKALIPGMNYRHHQFIQIMMKDVYNIRVCEDCGAYARTYHVISPRETPFRGKKYTSRFFDKRKIMRFFR